MSLQTTAAKLLFKLPAPLLNKVMKFLTPAKKPIENGSAEKPWHLKGNWAPVNEEITIDNLEVVGEIPKDLDGMYIRNGMNPQS